jgi:hypothetical protein
VLYLRKLPEGRCKYCKGVVDNTADTFQGIEVPEVLRKYIPGQPEFLPYVKDLPKDSTSLKQKAAAAGPATKIAPVEGATLPKKMEDMKV